MSRPTTMRFGFRNSAVAAAPDGKLVVVALDRTETSAALEPQVLRGAGLSARKAEYLLDLARQQKETS